jgi:hypothetical protein
VSVITTGFALDTPPIHASTFGYFDNGIVCDTCGSDGSKPKLGPLSLVVSSTSGLSVTDFSSSSKTAYVATNYYMASDIINENLLVKPTGNVGALGGIPAPEPMSLALPAPACLVSATSVANGPEVLTAKTNVS